MLAIAIALAADAFAVAVVAGLVLPRLTCRHILRLSFHFGFFQAMMPAIGWTVGQALHAQIAAVDHWIAFGLLVLVGGRMSWNAAHRSDENIAAGDPTTGWQLVLLSSATSIDALAVGFSLAMVGSPILVPALIIGLVTAAFTAAGMALGRRIGSSWGRRVEFAGGVILVLIGVKIFAEHLLA